MRLHHTCAIEQAFLTSRSASQALRFFRNYTKKITHNANVNYLSDRPLLFELSEEDLVLA